MDTKREIDITHLDKSIEAFPLLTLSSSNFNLSLKESAYEELKLAYEKIRMIINGISDGVFYLDEEFYVREANSALFEMLEINREEVINRSLESLGEEANFWSILKDQVKWERDEILNLEIELFQPKKLFLSARVSKIYGDQGKLKGWIIIIHDVTTQKRVDNMKNEFLNIVSHELRNPITVILGYANLLSRKLADRLSSEEEGYFSRIKELGKKFIQTADELIEFTQRDRRVDRIRMERFDLGALIMSIILKFQPKGKEKGVEIIFSHLDPSCYIYADRRMIDFVITELIENAISFTRPLGEVKVKLKELATYFQVDVEDNGIGIPKTELERIFDKFYQVEEHKTRHIGGMGLGLSLVKSMIKLHKGEIWVKSKLGVGTTFSFTLPKVPTEVKKDLSIDKLESELKKSHREIALYVRELADSLLSEKKSASNLMRALKKLQETSKALEDSNKQTKAYAQDLQRLNEELKNTTLLTVRALAEALDAKDEYMHGHSKRVTHFAIKIAQKMGIKGEELKCIENGALLHDIGNIGVSDLILQKPGKLREEEYRMIKRHPEIGYRIVKELNFLGKSRLFILYHHESFNGEGYPQGLKGKEIPLGARIIAVADTFDAITSPRPYRERISLEKALTLIKDLSEIQFDPQVVSHFINLVEEDRQDFKSIIESYRL